MPITAPLFRSSPSLGGRWRRPGGPVTEGGRGAPQLQLPLLVSFPWRKVAPARRVGDGRGARSHQLQLPLLVSFPWGKVAPARRVGDGRGARSHQLQLPSLSPSLGGRWHRPGGLVTEGGRGSHQLQLPLPAFTLLRRSSPRRTDPVREGLLRIARAPLVVRFPPGSLRSPPLPLRFALRAGFLSPSQVLPIPSLHVGRNIVIRHKRTS